MGRKGKQKKRVVESCEVNVDRVHIQVGTLSGESIEFDLAHDRPILAVKKRIYNDLRIPVVAQIISHDGLLTCDTDELLKYCGGDSAQLQFALVVSDVKIQKGLADENLDVRLDALRSIVELSEYKQLDAEQFLGGTLTCLGETDREVRLAALDVLKQVLCRGHTRAVGQMILLLHNHETVVRETACEALGLFADYGDAAAIDALVEQSGYPNIAVQLSVVEALGQISQEGNSKVSEALVVLWQDLKKNSSTLARKAVEETIFEALMKLAPVGDQCTVGFCLSQLEESCSRPYFDTDTSCLQLLARVACVDDTDDTRILEAMAVCKMVGEMCAEKLYKKGSPEWNATKKVISAAKQAIVSFQSRLKVDDARRILT